MGRQDRGGGVARAPSDLRMVLPTCGLSQQVSINSVTMAGKVNKNFTSLLLDAHEMWADRGVILSSRSRIVLFDTIFLLFLFNLFQENRLVGDTVMVIDNLLTNIVFFSGLILFFFQGFKFNFCTWGFSHDAENCITSSCFWRDGWLKEGI